MNVEAASPRHGTLRTAWERIPADLRMFLVVFAVWVPARIAHTVQVRDMGVDGGYYLEVARHVRDGDGLATNVSLYQFGYESFPHPTSVYPLWPWLLGMGGRLVDIELLAHWLPLGLSFLAVCAAFLFGRRLWPEPMFPAHVPGFHAGHLFALGLAVQRDFITFSGMPYTEPLAWLLVFLFLERVATKGADLGWDWAVEIGIWLGALYLARFQLVVAPMALLGAYAVRFVLGPARGRILAHGAIALGVAGLFIGGWFLHIRTFVFEAGLSSLLRFDQNRANDLLHEIDIVVDNASVWELVLDRAYGFLIAWEPASILSYAVTFHTLHWALPAAVPLLAVAGVRTVRQVGMPATLERLRRPEVAHWYFLSLFALGGLLSVHAVHKHFGGEWYFDNRQAMIALLAFLLPLGWLLRQHRPLATVFGVVILSSTGVLGINEVWWHVSHVPKEAEDQDRFPELIAWITEQEEADGHLIVALDTQVQQIAWRTEGVGYHWVYSDTPYEDFLTLTDRLGVNYVILKTKAFGRGWAFLSDPDRLERDFVRVPGGPASHVVFARRRPVALEAPR